MTQQTIVLKDGAQRTGRLIDFLGHGRVIIETDKCRFAGETIESFQRRTIRRSK